LDNPTLIARNKIKQYEQTMYYVSAQRKGAEAGGKPNNKNNKDCADTI
jgi:hypothetical protein